MKKTILLLGASGQVGRAVENKLLENKLATNQDYELIKVSHRQLDGFVSLDYFNMQSHKQWSTLFSKFKEEGKEISTVVNCIGIWSGTDLEFEIIQHVVPTTLMDVCAQENIHLIHVGALGFDLRYGDKLPYMTTKVKTQNYFSQVQSKKKTLILPSLIFGPDGNNAKFFSAISSLPIQADFGFGANIQPVHEDDIGLAVVEQIYKEEPDFIVECAGQYPISPAEYFSKLRVAQGKNAPWLKVRLPKWVGKTIFYAGSYLFKSHFINRQTWLLLETGSRSDHLYPNATEYSKFTDKGIIQEIKQIQLYWAMRLSVALVWLSTGLSFLTNRGVEETLRVLSLAHASLGNVAVVSISNAFDLVMGLCALFFASKKLWKLQFLATMPYAVGLLFLRPEMILSSFDSMTKNFVLLCAIAYLAMNEKK